MKLDELTKEQVLVELQEIINKYPDRKGNIELFDDGELYDTTCVYYLSEDGRPVTAEEYDYDYEDMPQLAQPVCIIGQWIEDFHPEFKEDGFIRDFLYHNWTVSNPVVAEHVMNKEVLNVLSQAQSTQDLGYSWSKIELEV